LSPYSTGDKGGINNRTHTRWSYTGKIHSAQPPMKPCKYLDELIDYGGEPHTRAEAILDMQCSNTCIDRWLQGYEHAQRRRERNQRITTKLYLPPAG
jgi:hypothetical protein